MSGSSIRRPKGRPTCLNCGKELVPWFEEEPDPNVPQGYSVLSSWWKHQKRPTALGGYGFGGYFHSGLCAQRFAVKVALKKWGDRLDSLSQGLAEEELRFAVARHARLVAGLRRRLKAEERRELARAEGLEVRP